MNKKLPSSVYAAIYIIWMETVISFIYGFFNFNENTLNEAGITTNALLFILFLYLLLIYWITKKLAQGRNWMRVLYTIMYVLFILFPLIYQVFTYLNGGAYKFDLANIAHQFISTVVICILYSSSSNQHFNKNLKAS